MEEVVKNDYERLPVHIFGVFTVGHRMHVNLDFKETRHNTNQNISRIFEAIKVHALNGGSFPLDTLFVQVTHYILQIPYLTCLQTNAVCFVQLDNTQSQNKNSLLMASLGVLVHRGLVDAASINFLMVRLNTLTQKKQWIVYIFQVGHTHCDIDRLFSYYSKAFKRNGNCTVDALKYNIETAYNDKDGIGKPGIDTLDYNYAWDIWLKDCMNSLKNMAIYHGFVIKMHDFGPTDGMQVCHYYTIFQLINVTMAQPKSKTKF